MPKSNLHAGELSFKPKRVRASIPSSLRFFVLHRDSFECRYCGAGAGSSLEVDHVIPVADGGDIDPENLVTACRLCNSGKSDKKLRIIPAQRQLAVAAMIMGRVLERFGGDVSPADMFAIVDLCVGSVDPDELWTAVLRSPTWAECYGTLNALCGFPELDTGGPRIQ